MQIGNPTEDEIALEPFADKWRAFGWNVIEVNGHNIAELVDVVDNLPAPGSSVPTVVICRTIKGRNISFMENNLKWHIGYLDTDELSETALADVQSAYEGGK